jgi:uncharacterized protein with HEPN domain
MGFMFDKTFVVQILEQILKAINTILIRFEPVKSVDDFTNFQSGMEKLDSICMQLIAIGESLKKLDKITKNKLLKNYKEINWKGVMGMRDIISHHYFDVDAEEIFWVCSNELSPLESTIKKMIIDLKEKE